VFSLQYFIGLFRRFRSRVLRREVEIVGQCKLCGRCCQDILLGECGKWLTSKRKFSEICERDSRYNRFRITGRDESGRLVFSCSEMGADNFCTCYETRLPLCKSYPAKSLYYQGGSLRPDCGFSFKAMTFRDIYMRRKRGRISPFSEVLRQEQEQAGKK
jgi:hypothetical protein